MEDLRAILRSLGISLLHPMRKPVTWACQRGFLSSKVENFLPWRWALEPFAIYGAGWTCQWFPTECDPVGRREFWSGLRYCEKETCPVILENLQRSGCFI